MEIVRRGLDVLSIEEKPERNAWASLAASCRGRRLIQTAKNVIICDLTYDSAAADDHFDKAMAHIVHSVLRPVYLSIELPEENDEQLRKSLRTMIQRIDCSRLAEFAWNDCNYEFCLPILMAGADTLKVVDLEVFPNIEYSMQTICLPKFAQLESIIVCPEIPTNALQIALRETAVARDIAIDFESNEPTPETYEEDNQWEESEYLFANYWLE